MKKKLFLEKIIMSYANNHVQQKSLLDMILILKVLIHKNQAHLKIMISLVI